MERALQMIGKSLFSPMPLPVPKKIKIRRKTAPSFRPAKRFQRLHSTPIPHTRSKFDLSANLSTCLMFHVHYRWTKKTTTRNMVSLPPRGLWNHDLLWKSKMLHSMVSFELSWLERRKRSEWKMVLPKLQPSVQAEMNWIFCSLVFTFKKYIMFRIPEIVYTFAVILNSKLLLI